jgi:hypothetical protein
MFFSEAQSFFDGAGGRRVELVRDAFAYHPFCIRIDFYGHGAGGNDFTANDNIQRVSPGLKSPTADKQRRLLF